MLSIFGTRNSSLVRIDDLYHLPGSDLTNPLSITGETLTIEGNLNLERPAATLRMDLAKSDAHDRLVVEGTAHLAGVLEIDLEAGFTRPRGTRSICSISLRPSVPSISSTFQCWAPISVGTFRNWH